MVLHIGINPLNGKVAAYDTDAKALEKFNVEKVTSNDIDKVESLFISIKNQINEDIGNACVCLDENYGNDIRLEFVKQATENGFYHFEIIDVNTALHRHAVSSKDFNLFWILWSKKCFIFSQKNDQIFFVKVYPIVTKSEVNAVKKLKPPEALFLQSDESQEVATKLCNPNKFIYYAHFEIEVSALSRAMFMNSETYGLNVVSSFGRKCEILLNKKSILTVLPDIHLPYEKVIEIKSKGNDNLLKIIENDANFKTLTFNKKSLLFYINSNGIYYISEINDLNANNPEQTKIIDKILINDSLHFSNSSKGEKPPIPTAAKPGINALLSKLKVSQDFNNDSDLIRQLGFIQTQINIIQPLTILPDFLLLTEKDSNYEEIEPIISTLDNSFKNLQLKLSDTSIMYRATIRSLRISIISDLKYIRQKFDENIIFWNNMKEFREKFASEIAWIESTEAALSSSKSVTSQNYLNIKKFCDATKSEMEKRDVKVKKFFTKTMKEIYKITQYEVFAHEYYNKWNALQEQCNNFSLDMDQAGKAYECLEKNKLIIERKNKLIEDASNSIKNSKDITLHETYVQELKAIEIEARNIKEELMQQRSEVNSYNAHILDFSIFESNFEEAIYDMHYFSTDVMLKIEKEQEIIRKLSEFDACYEALKIWINDKYAMFSEIDMYMLLVTRNEILTNLFDLMETKKIKFVEIQQKSAELTEDGILNIVYKTIEIETLWDKLKTLESDKKSEMNNIKVFLEKTEAIHQKINELMEASKAVIDRCGLEEILKNLTQLDDDIFNVEPMVDSLTNKYSNNTDACLKKLYDLQKVLHNDVLNGAKAILSEDLSVPTIYSISQLHQYFVTMNNATPTRNHSSPKLKRSSKVDESFRSFWQNRTKRQNNLNENVDTPNDDNWLKRMSTMPKFDIPQKYNIYDTKINAIGIDLGTSSCCVAVNRENRLEAAPIDNTGERTLPSYVAFDECHVKCGKVVEERLGSFSKCTIFDSKRIIGKKYKEIEKDPIWPFDVVEAGEIVQLSVQGHSNTRITKTPEEIASILLKHMKQKAEEFQGKAITKVVVTIPAAFTESQKETTLAAAKLAGLENVSLLPEPVAASFAYFVDRPLPNNATILLFDLGGGTLDICIFEIINSEFKIIRNTGDANIGGRNFDNILYDYFKAELFSRHKINVETKERMKYRLMLKCQEIKHMLSVRDVDGIDVDDYNCSIDDLPIKITRQEFERLSTQLIEDISTLLTYATKSLQQPIEKVLHVGGSSKIPMIKTMLEVMFPHAEQCCEVHPEEVVAIGAAYYSYHLALKQKNLEK